MYIITFVEFLMDNYFTSLENKNFFFSELTMASTQVMCSTQSHETSPANVLCRNCIETVCTRCYIDGKHKDCDVVDLKTLTSRYGKLAVEMMGLREEAKKKIKIREVLKERIDSQTKKLEETLDEHLLHLKTKLYSAKEKSRKRMEEDFKKHLLRADEQKKEMHKLMDSLTRAIDAMMDLEPDPKKSKSRRVNSEVVDLKQRAARKLMYVHDGEIKPIGRFVLANHLQAILNGDVRAFGDHHLHFVLEVKKENGKE